MMKGNLYTVGLQTCYFGTNSIGTPSIFNDVKGKGKINEVYWKMSLYD